MRISVILAHPDAGSFNHAVAKMAVRELRRVSGLVARCFPATASCVKEKRGGLAALGS